MKVTLNWLKQYVDFDWSPEELAERLTMIGIEVEGVVKTGGEFEGVVVARVITRDKHPNADKLSLCRVDDGKGERQIVCGAQNFKAGDKVPLILPGATLPAKPGEPPMTIKVGKIRGVESQGMLCSPQELGMSSDVEGLLILPEDAPVGVPFAQFLGRAGSDVIYDLEITPNRPDLNSLIGIAREISAITGGPLRIPPVDSPEGQPAVADLVAVRLDDPELCPRYNARVVKGVKIGPSPDWLRTSLEKVGVRSISNVVDVTNYVMLETGQPLHAFDYHLLAKGASGVPTIVVRRAAASEKFVTLDGQERTLTDQTLLIADEQHAIALAGVMGGLNTEINDRTVDVLIESACFKPQNIRATSKKLGLRTDASYRFERGSDIGACDYAGRRAAQLILQTAGGTLCAGAVDAYPQPIEPKQITLRHQKANDLLGLSLTPEQIEGYLSQLGLKPATRKPQPVGVESAPASVTIKVPTFRVDLKREVDLIEEIGRLYGVDKIPATPPRGAIGANAFDRVHDELAEARRILSGLGLNEACGQTLIGDAGARLAVGESFVALANPLSSDMNVLRPSLLPGLLDSLRHNLSHKLYDVALFEVGRVFSPDAKAGMGEERRIAIALTGQRQPLFWSGENREARFDIYDLKGLVDEFLEQFGARGISLHRREASTSLFLESATIHLGKFQIGEVGQVLPTLARQYDLRDAVFLAELSLDVLLARRNPAKFAKSLPTFPSIRRDVALVLPEAATHDAILQVIKQTKPAFLESVELFDVFRGKNVPPGRKSMAYALTYRNPERTLVDAEVNAAHEKVVQELTRKLDATIRE
jgi:phenylalanyl-tRNA synthetase beta chain